MSKQHLTDAITASPPVAVGGMTLLGYPLSDWVMLLTAVYTLFALYAAIYRHLKLRKEVKNDSRTAVLGD